MKITTQLTKFILVGFVNTAVHYSIFLFLFRVFDLHMLLSSGIGYLVGVINSFIINRRWTFEIVSSANWLEFSKFVVVNVFSLVINLAVLHMAVKEIGMMPEIGQVGAIGFAVVINFAGNKWWTFKA